ncbi:hypothetical protein JTB14_001105 [Gonioctena quinquepunctata]|nr:hypothetical protein JTB14_001105 [Gonioctena quinquepunctata]
MQAVIDFDKSTLCFRSEENCHNIDIVFKLNSNLHINLCKNEVDNSEFLDKKENNVVKHAYKVVDFESDVSQACTEDSNKRKLLNILVGNRSALSECPDPGQVNCYVHEMELNDESVFNALSNPILFIIYRNFIVHPDMKFTFYIESDSSDYALGGSLYQMSNEEEREVVAYTSKTFKEGQSTYPYLKSKAERKADKAFKKINPVEFEFGNQVLVRSHYQYSAEAKTIKKFFLIYKGVLFTFYEEPALNSYVISDEKGVDSSTENIIHLKAHKVLLNELNPSV